MKVRKWMVAGAVVAVAAGIGGGAAYAAWSASGGGTAAARALTARPLTVTAVAPGSAGASLYPGGPAGWVYFSVTNPNPYDVIVSTFQWGTPVSTDTANCPSANISVDPSAPTTASIDVPANATGSTSYQVFNVLDLSHSAPDGCQGVAFTVPVTITGVQK